MPYAELHCKTNFSFLEGASHAGELVEQAKLLEYQALAVTDRNSLAGAVRAHIAAKEIDLPLVIGAEITPSDALPVVLWATDRASYGRLCRLLTRGRRQAPKGECALVLKDIAELSQGLIAGVQPAALPEVCEDAIVSDLQSGGKLRIVRGKPSAEPAANVYREIFGDRCYLLAELVRGAD